MDRSLACLPTSHALSSSSSSSGGVPLVTSAVGGVTAGVLFDVSGLILYRTQALPIRLKVLLDRLMAGLPSDQVIQTLSAYGWTYEDYARGYMLQVCESTVNFCVISCKVFSFCTSSATCIV